MGKKAISLVVAFKGRESSTFAAVDYNEKKVAERHAYRAAMYNFGKIGEKDIHSARVIKKYLQKIADKNGSNHRPQKHMILSYPGKASKAETERMVKQAHQLLDLLGYAGQPQAIYVHSDTNHTHIHCVTCTVNRETGQTINQSNEGIRARRIIDQIRGVKHADVLERLSGYIYESRQQLMNLLWNNGYRYAHINEDTGKIVIPPFHHSNRLDVGVSEIDLADVDRHIEECGKNKDNFERRAKQLKQILLKYRRESLDYLVDTPPEKVRKKYGGMRTATQFLNQFRYGKFKGSNHLDMDEVRKEQLKMLLVKLKRELGIQIVFNEWKDGQVKGYTIIDHSGGGRGDRHHGIVWKGSDILNLQQFLNPDWKKGQETDAVISAKDAAETARELAPNPNSTRDEIVTILETYGIEYETEDIPEECFENTPQSNRLQALRYADNVAFLKGQQAIDCARKAYALACAADLQESMKKSGHQSPVRETAPERVLDHVLQTLDGMGIAHVDSDRALSDIMFDDPAFRNGLDPERMSAEGFAARAMSRLDYAMKDQKEGRRSYSNANKAVGYAAVVQRLLQMKAESQTAGKPDDKESVTPDLIVAHVLRTLDERGIAHLSPEKAYQKMMLESVELSRGLDPDKMSAEDFAARAMSRLERAVSGSLNPQDRDYAVGYAVVAQRLAQMEAQRQQTAEDAESVTQDHKESQGQQEPNQPLPFVDLHAEVRDGQIVARIDDTEHTADLHPMHQAWYDRQENKEEAANALAMHYFPKEIYEAQIYNYRQYFTSRGEMPQGVELVNPHAMKDYNGNVDIYSEVVFPDGKKDRYSKPLTREEHIGLVQKKYTERQLAVKELAPRVLESPRLAPRSFDQVKFQEPEYNDLAWETPEAVGETAKVFQGIGETLAGLAAATFGLAVGAGAKASTGGGGGGPGGGWRGKRDPEDWRHYDLFAHVGKKKSQLKR